LNKKFRIVQKVLDREISQVNHGVADLTGIASKPSPTTPEIMSAIDGVANKLTLLKRKVPHHVIIT
jgi:macrophage erythroblast attacher